MALPAGSPRFLRLAKVWRLLSGRHDVDSLILELLGQFALEKIYASGDKLAYQQLVTTWLIQLNAVFYIQRMSLPGADVLIGPYLGCLASWEVTARAVELVLHTAVEGKEVLGTAQSLRDKYLPETLLSALRFLMLHPKPPISPRARDRRDRYARIHQLLERILEAYPRPVSCLLSICRETTNCLRADPNAIPLPLKLKLPDLRSKMYPLADCLSARYVATIVPPKDPSDAWLPHFFTLRDVSLFVVGASIQCAVDEDIQPIDLQSASSTIRDAMLRALDDLWLPPYLSKVDLAAIFDETFQQILPSLSSPVSPGLTVTLENEDEVDALDMLFTKLGNRQILQRTSDKEMMHRITQVAQLISTSENRNELPQSTDPSLYVVNCPSCHVVGGNQLKHSESIIFLTAVDQSAPEASVKTGLQQSTCFHCGQKITVAREISLVKNIWGLLKPLENDSSAVDLERHLTSSFQLSPPSIAGSINPLAAPSHVRHGNDYGLQSTDPSPPYRQALEPGAASPDPSITASHLSPVTSHTSGQGIDSSQPHVIQISEPNRDDSPAVAVPLTPDMPFSPDHVGIRQESIPQTESLDRVDSMESREPVHFSSTDMIPPISPLVKRKSKWRSKWTLTRKNSNAASGDTSSLSSTTVESQKLEEVSLENLLKATKSSMRGRNAKKVNVQLSQNSTYALLWTQAVIHVWDVGTSPPTLMRTFSPESSCVLATITKIHLAYIIGTRDQKLTLRIVNLDQPSVPIVEHRMSSSLWCRSIAISPKEDYVAVGFDNAIVRLFELSNGEQPRDSQLHARYHRDCQDCPSVDNLSFSHDGLVLVGSTRNHKSGTVQIYSWKFPFTDFREFPFCRYNVPLLESEDNGITSALARSVDGEENLICITSWTQSGVPVLIQPHDGYKTEIKTDPSSRQGKIGNRIQCAAFSRSGKELAMVNDKGYLYHITNLDSTPMQIKRMATTLELTARSDAFAMTFMTLGDEDTIVLVWADLMKSVCLVKKIPIMPHGDISVPPTPAPQQTSSRSELAGLAKDIPKAPVELPANETPLGNA